MKNFDEIYKENHKMVLNFIHFKTKDVEASQELANDVFMKIHTNLSKYDENISSFKTWMMNIANHAVIDYWRKNKLQTLSINQEDDNENGYNWIANAITSNGDPERTLIDNETLDNFKNAVNKLPKCYVKIGKLFFNEQLTYDEIASTFNIPLGTVKGKLSRIKDMLETQNYVMR